MLHIEVKPLTSNVRISRKKIDLSLKVRKFIQSLSLILGIQPGVNLILSMFLYNCKCLYLGTLKKKTSPGMGSQFTIYCLVFKNLEFSAQCFQISREKRLYIHSK